MASPALYPARGEPGPSPLDPAPLRWTVVPLRPSTRERDDVGGSPEMFGQRSALLAFGKMGGLWCGLFGVSMDAVVALGYPEPCWRV